MTDTDDEVHNATFTRGKTVNGLPVDAKGRPVGLKNASFPDPKYHAIDEETSEPLPLEERKKFVPSLPPSKRVYHPLGGRPGPRSAPRCARETVSYFSVGSPATTPALGTHKVVVLATPSPQPGGGVEPRGSCSRHRGGRTPRMRTVGSVGPGPRAPRRRVQKTPTSRTTEESHRQINENGTRRR